MLCDERQPLASQGADRVVVFQNGALFPWKTLGDNVAYGPMVQGTLSKAEAREKARDMLAEAGLGDVADKYPGEVSSGMARRAEIVRALINDPKVLLLDEPYRAMDALTKSHHARDAARDVRPHQGHDLLHHPRPSRRRSFSGTGRW